MPEAEVLMPRPVCGVGSRNAITARAGLAAAMISAQAGPCRQVSTGLA
jgi:hypothetical protein